MVIIAEEQTGGVGRLGRAWVSPAGGIWITIVLKPRIPIDHLLHDHHGRVDRHRSPPSGRNTGSVRLIKWPNDIFVGDKKVGGLLLELAAEADAVHYGLLGIGIDANISLADLPPNLKDTVTSLEG